MTSSLIDRRSCCSRQVRASKVNANERENSRVDVNKRSDVQTGRNDRRLLTRRCGIRSAAVQVVFTIRMRRGNYY